VLVSPDAAGPSETAEPRYLPGASWGQAAAIALIVAVLAFAVGWKLQGSGDPGAGSVDVGFLQDMADHHDQADLMALMVMRPPSVSTRTPWSTRPRSSWSSATRSV
jgi:hypothetical protein